MLLLATLLWLLFLGLLVLTSVVVGATMAAMVLLTGVAQRATPNPSPPAAFRALLIVSLLFAGGGAIAAALMLQSEGRLLDAAMMFVLGLIAAALVALLPRLFGPGEQSRAALDPQWGTLGGENRGYSLSPTGSLLLIVLVGLAAAATLGYESKGRSGAEMGSGSSPINVDIRKQN